MKLNNLKFNMKPYKFYIANIETTISFEDLENGDLGQTIKHDDDSLTINISKKIKSKELLYKVLIHELFEAYSFAYNFVYSADDRKELYILDHSLMEQTIEAMLINFLKLWRK